jgi:hypothetical protein
MFRHSRSLLIALLAVTTFVATGCASSRYGRYDRYDRYGTVYGRGVYGKRVPDYRWEQRQRQRRWEEYRRQQRYERLERRRHRNWHRRD